MRSWTVRVPLDPISLSDLSSLGTYPGMEYRGRMFACMQFVLWKKKEIGKSVLSLFAGSIISVLWD